MSPRGCTLEGDDRLLHESEKTTEMVKDILELSITKFSTQRLVRFRMFDNKVDQRPVGFNDG